MNKLIYILAFIVTTTAIAQTTNTLTLEKQKLKQALAYGDKSVAALAMYDIVAIEGAQSTYKDSLAYLYFNNRNYVSCFLVTNDILSYKPNELELLEMKAISLESMGVFEQASEAYKALLSKTNNNYHAYKLASLQLALKKFEEAYVSVKKADQLPDEGGVKVNFKVNKTYNQNIDLKASIAYLEGIIALNLEKNEEAKHSFERAVKLFPDFVLAKGKLESLNAVKE
jgi:tetratricopeptide (TPR) repeat protein